MNNKLPLVSVAIATYNQKPFLRECIEAVLSQTYQNLEIVVGDDGSTDGTHEMLLEYDKQYPGTFKLCLSDINKGISVNSNNIHSLCTGKYVAWTGGDDLMLPTKIEKQVIYLESNPNCNIVYHHVEVFDSDSGKTMRLFNKKKDCHEGDIDVLIRYGTFNCACSNMIRRSSAPSYGFDNRLLVANDWFYWVEHLANGGEIKFINEILGRYRRHQKNVSSAVSPFYKQGVKDTFFTCELIREKFPQKLSILKYRMSDLYRWERHNNYSVNLYKSLANNPFSFKSLALLLVHGVSLGKIKL